MQVGPESHNTRDPTVARIWGWLKFCLLARCRFMFALTILVPGISRGDMRKCGDPWSWRAEPTVRIRLAPAASLLRNLTSSMIAS